MTSNSGLTQQLHALKPRHLEIMDRLLVGQTQRQIALELGMNEGRLSIIVNSPIFKLELRKRRLKREEKVLEIEESILEGGKLGLNYHKELLADRTPLISREAKQRSATVLATLAARYAQGSGGGKSEEAGGSTEGQSYEEILEEITLKKTHKVITQQPSEPSGDDALAGHVLSPGIEEGGASDVETLLSDAYPQQVTDEGEEIPPS